jgi:hypothetical protein
MTAFRSARARGVLLRSLGVPAVFGLALTAVAPVTATASSAPNTCAITRAAPGQWSRVGTAGLPLTWIGQSDVDPCVLVGVDGSAALWRSIDGGVTWRHHSPNPPIDRALTERLGRPGVAKPDAHGLVLASGRSQFTSETPYYQFETPQAASVSVSHDGGATFSYASAGSGIRLVAEVQAAASGTLADSPVYLVARAARTVGTEAGMRGAPPEATELLVSTDDGASFLPSAGAAGLVPTAVAVNPADANEVWINSIGATNPGAWVSSDAGQSFTQVCCAGIAVNDITIGQGPDGRPVVMLATDTGLLRSADHGQTFVRVITQPTAEVRTAPDDPATLIAVVNHAAVVMRGSTRSTPRGLPPGCAPSRLRVDASAPAVFVVDCAASGGSYRLALAPLAHDVATRAELPTGITFPGTPPWGAPLPATLPQPMLPLGPPIMLPGADRDSAALAFDGSTLYYKRTEATIVGAVDVKTGASRASLRTSVDVFSLGFDLRRNRLLMTTGRDPRTDRLVAFDPVRGSIAVLSTIPDKAPSYDSLSDGLSYIPERYPSDEHWRLYRDSLTGGPRAARLSCDFTAPTSMTDRETAAQHVSSFVASGDGGGYAQAEDDRTIYRIGPPPSCALLGTYIHRTYSEAPLENDALPCDAQTFFPRVAIWINDAGTGTAIPYAVPFGYCPLPSRLSLSPPASMRPGQTRTVCATLTYATTHVPALDRVVTLFAGRTLVGRARTSPLGQVCLPVTAVTSGKLAVSAVFTGDSALFPAHAATTIAVVGTAAPAPPPRHVSLPPPAPATVALIPPNPVPLPAVNAPAVPAPAPAAAANAVHVAQAQAQPAAQGAVAAQRQTQPQLSLSVVQQQLDAAGEHPMVAPAHRSYAPGLIGLGLAVAAASGCARFAASFARQSAHVLAPPRGRTIRRGPGNIEGARIP